MSDAAAGLPSADEPAPEGTAGAALLRERRRQGLSLGDISRQLKLSVRQVEALERDDYSGYKGAVFIHGFIRNYAKLLHLEPEPLIRATDLLLNPPVDPLADQRDKEALLPMRAHAQKSWLWSAIATVVVIGIAVSVYVGARRAPPPARDIPSVAAGDKRVSSANSVANVNTDAAAKVKSGPKQAGASAAKPAPQLAAKPVAKPAPKPESTTPANTGSVEPRAPIEAAATETLGSAGRLIVRMIFDQDSWVEIKDRDGNTIFGQLNAAGSRRSVSGEPPLSVVVGNAAGVRLFNDEQIIDLTPHTLVDVARLTLN